MAINLLVPLLIPLEEQLKNVTRLLGEEVVRFPQPLYQIALNENEKPGLVLQLKAHVSVEDADVKYSIVGGNNDQMFHLDGRTGKLETRAPLDFEQMKQYELKIEAKVNEESSSTRVIIDVTDINEFPPHFSRQTYETQITEEDDRHLPKKILKVSATDSDGGRWGKISFRLFGPGAEDIGNGESRRSHQSSNARPPLFRVDPQNGDVLLLKPLDRDPPNGRSQWRLKIIASDGEMENESNVIINVKDINDNAPYFPKEKMNSTVKENSAKGTFVTKISAKDNDDPQEATNTRMEYSFDKNVVDEITGYPIFSLDKMTGEISTAICCIDREKTPSFAIQVVASDGGGLKGTGTVVVKVEDENDVAPSFGRDDWVIKVNEQTPLHLQIGTISVIDPDTTNEFNYRVSERKKGSEIFSVRGKPDGSGADIYSTEVLDFENQSHRKDFRFKVEVTDQGTFENSDPSRIATSWVNLVVVNTNDNKPTFDVKFIRKTVREDLKVDTILAKFHASDKDVGEWSRIVYKVEKSGNDTQFKIDDNGVIRLAKSLDRETSAAHKVIVTANDLGTPSHTASATLQVDVTDANDNAPHIASNRTLYITENLEPQVVAEVYLDDRDDWTLGHGPPFYLQMDPAASRHIKNTVRLSFNQRANDSVGKGVLETLRSLDREQEKVILIPLLVSDSGEPKQSATVTLTLIVGDVNDNMMKHGFKEVTIYVFEPVKVPIPIGRVYVRDDDDWDVEEKRYSWIRPHPQFSLDEVNGQIVMRPFTQSGRYSLRFNVDDPLYNQYGINANVSVEVVPLANLNLQNTAPLKIEMSTEKLFSKYKDTETMLEHVMEKINNWSINENTEPNGSSSSKSKWKIISVQAVNDSFSNVWIYSPKMAVAHVLLNAQNKDELRKIFGTSSVKIGHLGCADETSCVGKSCWSRIDTSNGYNLVDANHTSFVGPNLSIRSGCGCAPKNTNDSVAAGSRAYNASESRDFFLSVDKTSTKLTIIPKTNSLLVKTEGNLKNNNARDKDPCAGNDCLNKGKCVPQSRGYRCICPPNSFGGKCKILERTFFGPSQLNLNRKKRRNKAQQTFRRRSIGDIFNNPLKSSVSWAWVKSLPTCSNVHISFEFKSLHNNAILLYANGSPDHYYKKANRYKRMALHLRHRTVQRIQHRLITTPSTNPKKRSASRTFLKNIQSFYRGRLKKRKRSLSIYLKDNKSPLTSVNQTSDLSKVPYNSKLSDKQIFPHLPNVTVAKYRNIRKSGSISAKKQNEEVLLLQLKDGRPSLVLGLGDGITTFNVDTDISLSGNDWHRIDIYWDSKEVYLAVDLCANLTGNVDELKNPNVGDLLQYSNSSCLAARPLPGISRQLNSRGFPLQLGGLSNLQELPEQLRRDVKPALRGCVRNLRINNKVTDLGYSLIDHNSSPGCRRNANMSGKNSCSNYEHCRSQNSDDPNVEFSFTLVPTSFVSFDVSKDYYASEIEIFMRLKTVSFVGNLIQLWSSKSSHKLRLRLGRDLMCVLIENVYGHEGSVCLNRILVTDGEWHSINFRRRGFLATFVVDEGDNNFRNTTLIRNKSSVHVASFQHLEIGNKDFGNVSVLEKDEGLENCCVEGLVINGVSIPLPAQNSQTAIGNLTSQQNILRGCKFVNQCDNENCPSSMQCVYSSIGEKLCRCKNGDRYKQTTKQCEDINECLWKPCFNAGICHNRSPGFDCQCGSGFNGTYCEIGNMKARTTQPAVWILAGFSAIVVFLLVFVALILARRKITSKSKGRKKINATHKQLDITDDTSPVGGTYSLDDNSRYEFARSKNFRFKNDSSDNGAYPREVDVELCSCDDLKMKLAPHARNVDRLTNVSAINVGQVGEVFTLPEVTIEHGQQDDEPSNFPSIKPPCDFYF